MKQVVYLGISGVLHPSESMHSLIAGSTLEEAGHAKFQDVPILVKALAGYPDAQIVLTSTVPWRHGLAQTKAWLGEMGVRVISCTYEDLTTKVPWRSKSGKPRDDADYWRMDKSGIVEAHAAWLKPESWIVIDDEDINWADDVREKQLVLTKGWVGLCDPEAQERLRAVLRTNFGEPARA